MYRIHFHIAYNYTIMCIIAYLNRTQLNYGTIKIEFQITSYYTQKTSSQNYRSDSHANFCKMILLVLKKRFQQKSFYVSVGP